MDLKRPGLAEVPAEAFPGLGAAAGISPDQGAVTIVSPLLDQGSIKLDEIGSEVICACFLCIHLLHFEATDLAVASSCCGVSVGLERSAAERQWVKDRVAVLLPSSGGAPPTIRCTSHKYEVRNMVACSRSTWTIRAITSGDACTRESRKSLQYKPYKVKYAFAHTHGAGTTSHSEEAAG